MNKMEKPIIKEVFADNGEHSHWVLIDNNSGEVLWSGDYREPINHSKSTYKEPYIDIKCSLIKDIVNHLPKYMFFNDKTGEIRNMNSGCEEGIEGDKIVYYTYFNKERITREGTVKGYTDYQVIETYEYGREVLTSEFALRKSIYKNKSWKNK